MLLKEVAECLNKENLTIGLHKSTFCFKYLRYLGFIFGERALRTDPKKVEAIMKIEVPQIRDNYAAS